MANQQEFFDSIVKDPEQFAKGMLAAARRLKKKRADYTRWKKRQLARQAHKKIPR